MLVHAYLYIQIRSEYFRITSENFTSKMEAKADSYFVPITIISKIRILKKQFAYCEVPVGIVMIRGKSFLFCISTPVVIVPVLLA